MTVEELLARMSWEEFGRWVRFDQVVGLPNPWLQTGVIVSNLANCWITKGRRARPHDFMPVERPPVKRPSPAALVARWKAFAAAHRVPAALPAPEAPST